MISTSNANPHVIGAFLTPVASIHTTSLFSSLHPYRFRGLLHSTVSSIHHQTASSFFAPPLSPFIKSKSYTPRSLFHASPSTCHTISTTTKNSFLTSTSVNFSISSHLHQSAIPPENKDQSHPSQTRLYANTTASFDAPSLPIPEAISSTDIPKQFDPTAVEQDLYRWWESSGFFKPASDYNKDASVSNFTLTMPPPNVTGGLHMGHAMFCTIEDIIVRYQRMTGKNTLWLPGTDHAGIATQMLVERNLMEKEKIKKEALGRDAFLERIWAWKNEKGGYITKQLRRLGASCDWSRERFTLEEDFSNAVLHAFKTLYDQDLIYKGDYMVNWSPNLQTAVSDLEVEASEEEGSLFYFKYPIYDPNADPNADPDTQAPGFEFLPVSTTRPETILGDTAVCVHPEDERYKHLIGKMALVPIVNRQVPIIADDYVDMEFGTGALKITPGHDYNDYEIGKRHNLPIINIMNKDATINDVAGDAYNGLDRFVCREKLWKDMEAKGLAIKIEPHTSRVPRSQRGGEVIEPLVSTQWFVKMKPLAEPALEAVRKKEITILPERFEKVYFDWLENIHDWCISRQLWWGHRIPVYYIEEHPGKFVVAGNEQDAIKQANAMFPDQKDQLSLRQETDVLDTWFSSGLWPFATMGWPNTDSPDFQKFHPNNVMETGYDILFFWVARMIMMGMHFTGKVPFQVVYLHGLVRDAKGRKMSKTLGNVIDPLEVIDQFGTDPLRYTLITGSTPGQDINLNMEKVEANRNFTNKLWNAGRYLLGNLDKIDEQERTELACLRSSSYFDDLSNLPLPERYIISQLHALVSRVTENFESYNFGESGRQIQEFLWDEFADWYIEISKTRLYGTDEDAKKTANKTLVYVLDTCLRLLHPIMPYVTESIWQRLPHDAAAEPALIVGRWPKSGAIDKVGMERFAKTQAMIRMMRNVRAEYQVEHSKRINAIVVIDDANFVQELKRERAMIINLAKVDENNLEIGVKGQVSIPDANDALHLIVDDGVEVFLPMKALIDYEKEAIRLQKQLSEAEKNLEGLLKRLNAKGFADKAPAAVVEDTKKSAAQLEEKVASIKERLQYVENMAATAVAK